MSRLKYCPCCLRVFMHGKWQRIHSNGDVGFYTDMKPTICPDCRHKLLTEVEPFEETLELPQKWLPPSSEDEDSNRYWSVDD